MAKTKTLEETLVGLNKKFGEGSVYKFGDGDGLETEFISTGSIKIDNSLGGGIVRGRMIELYGPESSGKSTAALHMMASAQQMGMQVAYVDGEHSFDPDYAEIIGVNVKEMYYVAPYNLEDSIEITKQLAEAGMFIIYDSTNSLPLRAETDDVDGVGSHHVGREGKIMSQGCRMINPSLDKNGSTIVWISQLRSNIGAMGNAPKDVVGRGNALKFYATTRISFRRVGSEKQQGEKISNNVKVVVAKNKKGTQYAETEVEILFGKGYNKTGEILDFAIEYDIIQKRGAWFEYIDSDGVIVAKKQGKPNMVEELESLPDVLENLRLQILDKLNN